jgi:hypothetical protein
MARDTGNEGLRGCRRRWLICRVLRAIQRQPKAFESRAALNRPSLPVAGLARDPTKNWPCRKLP